MVEKTKKTSGVERLDHILGGLYIGDNVIWLDDAGSLAWVYCLNFLQASRVEDRPIIFAGFDRPPKSMLEKLGDLAAYPNLIVLDCFTRGKGESSGVFLRFYQEGQDRGPARVILVDSPRDVNQVNEVLYGLHADLSGDVRLVFDSLTGMQELWGGEDQLISFYRHACPRLYELRTIAYWIMEKKAHSARLKAQISQVAQVVIDLAIRRGTTSLTVLKAEDRDTVNLHQPHLYWTKGRQVQFDGERRFAGGMDLGLRIKELRLKKGFSQTELARLVGVTPSTISQVESNLICPSLPALMKMAEVLLVEVSSFFRESQALRTKLVFDPDEALAARLPALDEGVISARRLTPIDLDVKIEPFLLEIPPGQSLGSHFFFHKGEEMGYVLSGKCEMRIESKSYELKPGQVVYLTAQTPSSWKNHGDQPARLLWFKVR
ncbi:MAG: cupin domain-containing protein [Thermodesulfobacteriota bacterium]